MMDTRDWILLAVIFYVCIFTMTCLYAFVMRRSSLFEPIGMYLFFVTLYALPLPIRCLFTMEIEGDISPYLPDFAPYLPLSLVMTAMALPIFAAGYYSRLSQTLGAKLPLLAQRSVRGTGVAVLLLVTLSGSLIYLLTQQVGGIVPFLLMGYKSTEATFGRGYLAIGFPWMIVAMVALLERWAVTRSRLDFLASLVMLTVNLAVDLVTGNRAQIMYIVIVLIIFVNFRLRRLSLKVILPIAVIGFVFLNLMGYLRNSEYSSFDDFIQTTSKASEGIQVGVDNNTAFYTVSVGQFVVPFETLPQMIRSVGVTEWPWLGLSYLRSVLYLIPSLIFPDRPDSLGVWYMKNYYGGGYGLNEGRAFFFLAEGYLNFGLAGIVLVSGAWGVLWGALHRWMALGRDRFGTVLIYSLTVGFMFRCIDGEFATIVAGITQQSLIAVVLILVVSNIFGSRRQARKSGARAT